MLRAYMKNRTMDFACTAAEEKVNTLSSDRPYASCQFNTSTRECDIYGYVQAKRRMFAEVHVPLVVAKDLKPAGV
jgi:hypothetical protein